jgi:hypothetical protein
MDEIEANRLENRGKSWAWVDSTYELPTSPLPVWRRSSLVPSAMICYRVDFPP